MCDYNFMDININLAKIIKPVEKTLLAVIAILTVIAVFQEIYSIYLNGKVQLADLLLLFIYTEVLGMIGIFYVSNKIPITLPLFIAMTAIARLIILQGKGMDPIILIYEAGAILIIALACLVIRYKPKNSYVYQSEDENTSTTLVHNKINKK
jgi:protein PsiE